uniref:Uncharacterized protein n=1 Tax=Cucumis melo TaxID=3656 RepID=A0A9I9CCB2_CUCME
MSVMAPEVTILTALKSNISAKSLARVKDLQAFVWARFKMYTAMPFKSIGPTDFNTLEQNGGFEVFEQMVETTSVDDVTLIVNKRTPMRETIMSQEFLATLRRKQW